MTQVEYPPEDLATSGPIRGRIWSLWDMLKIHAEDFLDASEELLASANTARRIVEKNPAGPRQSGAARDIDTDLTRSLEHLRKNCQMLQLRLTVMHIDRFLNSVVDLPRLATYMDEIHRRFRDELTGRAIYCLIPNREMFYEQPLEGWEVVVNRYPTIVTDVEESSKCFACERYAAAVHHTLIVVEHGLLDLGSKIGVNDPKSGWTAVTNRLYEIVIKHDPTKATPYTQQHFAALEQVHGTVEALKNAWRNKIDHAQNALRLMTSDFTPEVAGEIITATRAFMRRLATELL